MSNSFSESFPRANLGIPLTSKISGVEKKLLYQSTSSGTFDPSLYPALTNGLYDIYLFGGGAGGNNGGYGTNAGGGGNAVAKSNHEIKSAVAYTIGAGGNGGVASGWL